LSFRDGRTQELRAELAAEYELGERTEMDAKFELRRFPDEALNFGNLLQVALSYELFNDLKLGISYRYMMTSEKLDDEVGASRNSDKRRYTFDIDYDFDRWDNDIRLSYRFRNQYSFFHPGKTSYKLRNRLKLDYKISKSMYPFVAIEPAYECIDKKLDYIRLYLGTEFEINNTDLEICYIAENRIKNSKPDNYYILGLAMKINLN
jgi:hypothetical protein